MKSMRTLLLPLISGVALLFAALHVASTHEVRQTLEPPVQPARSPYSLVIAGAGLVEPRSEKIKVGTLLPGVVTEVAVKAGQHVARGALLFKLDERERRAEVEVRRAQVKLAEAQLQRLRAMPRAEDLPVSEASVSKARADLAGRKDLMDRSERLLSKSASTQEELTQRQQSYAWAVAELTRAEADDARLKAGSWQEDLLVAETQLSQARQILAQAEIELSRLEIRAPIDGTVLKVDVRPGEYVGTPPNQTLMILGDIEALHVRVDIDENDLPRFRPGLPGQGFIRGDALAPLDLKFVRLEQFAEPKKSLTGAGNERVDTRVLQAIYAITSSNRTVYVGQQIDVYLNAE